MAVTERGSSNGGAPHLTPTRFLDFEHQSVAAFAASSAGSGTAREQAVRLFYAVRDGIRYDPYDFRLGPEWLRASRTLEAGVGWCVPKAILLAACCRAVGIEARLGFADVKNHLATERLLQLMGTDQFLWHAYVSIHLEGRWVKATPSFNIELCRRFGVPPLEFDGIHDSVLQPYDGSQRRYMEYLRERGLYDDLPYDAAVADWRAAYPRLVAAAEAGGVGGRFEADRLQRD
jgi:transglutaminase-like putative cysteine protease